MQSQNHLLKKNGYYFYETGVYRHNNYVPYGTGAVPLDSTRIKVIDEIIFYENAKVYITNHFDGLLFEKENSLEVAQEKLENRIDAYNLKGIDTMNTHISTLGKYEISNDTITIQYFRFSFGDRFLTEVKGILKDSNNFHLFERTDFSNSWSKPKPYAINKKYTFKEY